MARQINKLSDRGVRAQHKSGRYADGNGLYLQVSKSGSKSWIFRYMIDAKPREMGLGSVLTVALSEARIKALQYRKNLHEGIDPIRLKNERLALAKKANIQIYTFKKCTEEYLRAHSASWKSTRHAEIWHSSVRRFAYPVLGSLSVNVIERGHIMRVLDPIWRTKTETAKKLRGRLEAILDWASVQDYRSSENPARWKGHLDKLLPKPSELHKVNHFAALPYEQIYDFMNELDDRDATSAQALRLLILTATRSGEVRGAKWSEINLDKAVWLIPAERMKAKVEHIIPLCDKSLSIIQSLPRMVDNDLLFFNPKSGKPLSDVVFKKLMERMGRTGFTTHGFRSTFRDWAAERTSFPREVIESALAHQLKDKAEAAYFRSNLLDKRRELMNVWMKYINTPKITDSKIINFQQKN